MSGDNKSQALGTMVGQLVGIGLGNPALGMAVGSTLGKARDDRRRDKLLASQYLTEQQNENTFNNRLDEARRLYAIKGGVR